jgi:uncharacterized protein YwbE
MRERNPDWSGTRLNIHDVDGAYTVLQSDSGKVFMLSSTGGACEITLPVAANLQEGWHAKFVVKEDTPTGVITMAAGSAIIDMVMKDPGGNASNSTVGTAKSNILLRATCTQGDYVNIFTDGSTYYAEAISGIDDAIDFS